MDVPEHELTLFSHIKIPIFSQKIRFLNLYSGILDGMVQTNYSERITVNEFGERITV